MTQRGTVSDRDDHFVFVSVKQSTACDGCHRTGGCASCASYLCVKAHNDCGAAVGDEVEIETSTGRVLLYAFFVFIFPFFPAAAAFFLVKHAVGGIALPVAAAVAALALFFLLLRLTLDKSAGKRCDQSAVRVIRKGGDNDGASET